MILSSVLSGHIYGYNSPESRLVYDSLRIVVAELSHTEKSNRSLGDQGFQECIVLRRYCLLLFRTDFLTEYRRIKFRIKKI